MLLAIENSEYPGELKKHSQVVNVRLQDASLNSKTTLVLLAIPALQFEHQVIFNPLYHYLWFSLSLGLLKTKTEYIFSSAE